MTSKINNPLKPTVPAPIRDDLLIQKWNKPRVVYDDANHPPKVGLDCSNDPSMTDQSQAAECDINNILRRYEQTGVLPGVDKEKLYADVYDAPTYQESLNIVLLANEQFNALDAKTRLRFGNDPAEFLKFVDDPKNAQELVDMGLATPQAVDPIKSLADEMRASREGSVAEATDSTPRQPAPKPKKGSDNA